MNGTLTYILFHHPSFSGRYQQRGQDIVLFGAGGAATAIMVQCALDGAKSITVFNRSKEGLDHVAGIGQKMMDDGIKQCLYLRLIRYDLLNLKQHPYRL